MKQITLNSLTGDSRPSRPLTANNLTGSVILRIDAAQVDHRNGSKAAAKLDLYFAGRGLLPSAIPVDASDVAAGVSAHYEANKERQDEIMNDSNLSREDRSAMLTYLGDLNHKLKNALLGRGELPVVQN
jgi:hypothetical protein